MCMMQQRQQLRRPGHTRRRREVIKGLTVGRPLRRRGETPRKTALGERQRGGAQLEGRGGVLAEGGGLGPSLTGMLGGQFGATDFGR